jgi:hypothetical protein
VGWLKDEEKDLTNVMVTLEIAEVWISTEDFGNQVGELFLSRVEFL